MADVEHQTRIHWSVIEALEAEEFSVFSSPLYAKSFLSQYSAFVGVDATPWIELFEPTVFVGADVVEPLLGSGAPARAVPYRDHAAEAPRAGGLGQTLLVLGATGLLVVAAVSGYRFYEERFGDEGAAELAEQADRDAPPPELPPVVDSAVTLPEEAQAADGELPPRAIIVREP